MTHVFRGISYFCKSKSANFLHRPLCCPCISFCTQRSVSWLLIAYNSHKNIHVQPIKKKPKYKHENNVFPGFFFKVYLLGCMVRKPSFSFYLQAVEFWVFYFTSSPTLADCHVIIPRSPSLKDPLARILVTSNQIYKKLIRLVLKSKFYVLHNILN